MIKIKISVHGDIRHLETASVGFWQINTVHGDIRHLEISTLIRCT